MERDAAAAPKTGNKLRCCSVFGARYERGHGVFAVGHQGMKDVILRVRGRPGGDMLVVPPSEDRWIVMAGLAGRIRAGQVSSSERSAGNEPTLPPDSTTRPRCPRMRIEMDVDGPRPVARLGIGFAESHAAPHERALGRLLSAASSAQHPPARSPNSPFLYDISQRSETRASPNNTFTQRAKEPPYQRVYIVFFSRPNSAQCLSYTKLRWIIYL